MKKYVLFIVMLVISFSNICATTISLSVEYSMTSLKFVPAGEDYEKVFLGKTGFIDKPGDPQLPVDKKYISIPLGAAIDSIIVSSHKKELISGRHSIFPVQQQAILSTLEKNIPHTQSNKSVYESYNQYPGKLIEYKGSGNLNGNHLAEILIYPIQYIPAEKQLEFYSSIGLSIYYHNDTQKSSPPKAFFTSNQSLYNRSVEVLTGSAPSMVLSKDIGITSMEYLIITKSPFDTVFQRLADWKTSKGVSAAVRSVNWIEATYPGSDVQEKIRNYLKIAHNDSGLVFLLLGGDVDVVPVRNAYAMDCEMDTMWSRDNVFPCDLYYSDLDGTWNENGNSIYGEVADSVDLYPDIFVGRASVDSLHEAQAFVDKILTYEKNPPVDYLLKALFDAGILWDDPYTDAGIAKDMIDVESIPDRFTISKNYASLGVTTSSFDLVNAGQNLINHDDHGWYNVGIFDIPQMDAFTNNPRNGILYSIGCWTNAFDYDAISEHFVNNPNGGGVAYIGNTSYGWGSPGNPGYGYSDLFDAAFFRELFHNNFYRIGTTLAQSKASYIAQSREENVYRWHQYDINLIGDPEMPIWTDTPGTLTVAYPQMIPTGPSQVRINVGNALQPLANALVCLQKGTEVYMRGYTAAGGDLLLDISPSTTGKMTLTVTAQNHIPVQADILVGDSLAYVDIIRYIINDSSGGNGDGMINPGETVDLAIMLKNFGNLDAPMVSATIRCGDSLVSILDSQEVYGNILPGDSSSGTGYYRFAISGNATNGHALILNLHITDSLAKTWTATVSLPVSTPVLTYFDHGISDTASNNNGLAEPGETIGMNLSIKNKGIGIARGVACSLSTGDTAIIFIDTVKVFGDISPDSVAACNFNIYISPGSPLPQVGVIKLSLATGDGYFYHDSLAFEIGQSGYVDIMEHEPGGWTHGGTNDLWHVTSHRKYLGFNSWYCGQESTWQYMNNMKATLESPPFILGPNSKLSFYRKYGLTLYGTDGLFTEIFYQGKWDTLGYIGSGGALNPILGLSGDWAEEVYDLSQFGYGDTARIKFTFISDDYETSEGFYIDNFKVENANKAWPDAYLSLQKPNGGEIWTGNQTIEWIDSIMATPCSADVYLSRDGGDTWNALALDIPDSGFFNYNSLSTIDGVRNKIGLCIHGGLSAACDISDSVFIINNPDNAAPELSLIPPETSSISGNYDWRWMASDADQDEIFTSHYVMREGTGAWQEVIGNLSSNPNNTQIWQEYNYAWNTDTMMNSLYQIKTVCYDSQTSTTDSTGAYYSIYNHHTYTPAVNADGTSPFSVNWYTYNPNLISGHSYEVRFKAIIRGAMSGYLYPAEYKYDLWDATSNISCSSSWIIPATYTNAFYYKDNWGQPYSGFVIVCGDEDTTFKPSLGIIDSLKRPVADLSVDTLSWVSIITPDMGWAKLNTNMEVHWHVTGTYPSDTLWPEVWDVKYGVAVPYDSTILNNSTVPSWNIGGTAIGLGRRYITSTWPTAVYSFINLCGFRIFFNRKVTSRVMTWVTHPQEGDVWRIYASGSIPPREGDVYSFAPTGVNENLQIINNSSFLLSQNAPNPFSNSTVIRYQLPQETRVKIKIYNITGQLVKTLVDQNQERGVHIITWRGTNESGNTVSAGLYFYRLETNNFSSTKRMLLLK